MIQIDNKTINIYGTTEIPLFEASQVIVQVLEYKQLDDCRFYKDNKTNPLFVSRIENKQASGVLPVGVWGTNQYSNTTIHLTEFGLYECLFSSNKQIAQQFRIQIMTLLSDIRIGNIKLLVERECKTTQLLAKSEQDLMAYITNNYELQQQVTQLQQRLESSFEEVHIYEIEINGRLYRGSALELIRRLKQHMRKSSNPEIRRACSESLQITTRLLHSQRISNRNERNYVERQFIQQIPSDLRINKSIPRVRNPSQVSEECKIQLNQALQQQDLSVIDDITLNNAKVVKQQCIDKWKSKYNAYYNFTQLLKTNPCDSIKDRSQQLIAKWVYKQRLGYDQLEHWQQELLSKIQYFKPSVKVINTESFEVKLQKVVDIYKQKGNLTSANLGTLFHWYCDYSKKMKLNEIGDYERVLFNQSGIPLYMTSYEQWMEYYNQCLQIYTTTKKLPVDKPVQGQFNLGRWCRRQISEGIDKLSDEQIKLLSDIGLTQKKNTNSNEYQQLFKAYLEQNNRLPSSTGEQKEVYLYKWMLRNKANPIISDLIKSLQ